MNKFIDNLFNEYGIKLTEKQKAVAEHTIGPALVLSCAGSGKTTVNIIKCANLIIEHGINPENILSVTFSKAAALEMDSRFNRMFGKIIKNPVKFSTIHALAYKFVREYNYKNRINITMIEDERSPIKKIALIKELNKKFNRRNAADEELDELISAISYCKNMLLPNDMIQAFDEDIPKFSSIFQEYESYKRKNNLIDYDDMLTLANEYLEKDKNMLLKYRNQYKYIIVDEAQDTSKVQYKIIEKLIYPNNNITLIGDDDQAIYGFRGAFPDYLLNFPQKFSGAKVFYMDENFRSTKNIVSHAGTVIKNNTKRYRKRISTSNAEGSPVDIIKLDNDEQIQCIINDVTAKKDKSDAAVLYRNNISSIALADALDRNNILFYLRDFKGYFFSHWVTRDIIAFLRVASNPKDIDSYKMIYSKTGNYIKREAVQFVEDNIQNISIFYSLTKFYKDDNRMINQVKSLAAQFKILDGLSPELAIPYIQNIFNYDNYLKANAERLGYSVDNLREIILNLHFIAKSTPTNEAFINRLIELQDKMETSRFNKHKNAVTLSTIHSAKGLEFKEVYVIDLIDNVFPTKSAIKEFKDGKIDSIEEERRIYYVAITRAKDKLTLFGVKNKNSQVVAYSRFLMESISALRPAVNTPPINIKNTGGSSMQHPVKRKESTIYINVGTRIYHRKFGEGTILGLSKDGTVRVKFDDCKYGIKNMLLQYSLDNSLITPI